MMNSIQTLVELRRIREVYDPESAQYVAISQALEWHVALEAIFAEPYGCRFCDSGKLRTPNNPAKFHDDNCGFWMAYTLLKGADTPDIVRKGD